MSAPAACPRADAAAVEVYVGRAGRGDEVEGRVYTAACPCGATLVDGEGLDADGVAAWLVTHEEEPPPPQTCDGCYRDFPAEDPMVDVGDAGTFCSYGCVAQWLDEGSMDHCRTHEELVEAHGRFAATLARIMGGGGDGD